MGNSATATRLSKSSTTIHLQLKTVGFANRKNKLILSNKLLRQTMKNWWNTNKQPMNWKSESATSKPSTSRSTASSREPVFGIKNCWREQATHWHVKSPRKTLSEFWNKLSTLDENDQIIHHFLYLSTFPTSSSLRKLYRLISFSYCSL